MCVCSIRWGTSSHACTSYTSSYTSSAHVSRYGWAAAKKYEAPHKSTPINQSVKTRARMPPAAYFLHIRRVCAVQCSCDTRCHKSVAAVSTSVPELNDIMCLCSNTIISGVYCWIYRGSTKLCTIYLYWFYGKHNPGLAVADAKILMMMSLDSRALVNVVFALYGVPRPLYFTIRWKVAFGVEFYRQPLTFNVSITRHVIVELGWEIPQPQTERDDDGTMKHTERWKLVRCVVCDSLGIHRRLLKWWWELE